MSKRKKKKSVGEFEYKKSKIELANAIFNLISNVLAAIVAIVAFIRLLIE